MKRPCVRCGESHRHVDIDGNETFMCAECLVSTATHQEIANAIAADPDHPRFWLKQFGGWRGGWGRAA